MGDGGAPTHSKNLVDGCSWYAPWRNESVAWSRYNEKAKINGSYTNVRKELKWSLYTEKTKINGDYLLSLQTKGKTARSTSQKRIGMAVLRRSIPNLQRLWVGQ